MDDDTVLRASAAEVARNFGLWQDRAQRRPVEVTSHGRPRIVMVEVEEFRRLKRRDRRALRVEELGDDVVAAIAATEPPAEAARFDDEVG